MRRSFTVTCLLAIVLSILTYAADAADFKSSVAKDGKIRIDLVGEIQVGDSDKLRLSVKSANDQNRLVATIRLNSSGGNILESVKIAEMVRNGKIFTSVLSGHTCASACFIIFAAGNEKFAHYSAMIGVHGASDESGRETIEAGAATVSMARVIRELGVPNSIIGKMVVTPPEQMVWLSSDDLKSMGVTMFGKPEQLSVQRPATQLQQGGPLSIVPQTQASRTPATWENLVEKAISLSEKQNGGRSRISRTCQPELKICNMGVWVNIDGGGLLLKAVTDMSDKVVRREICKFNKFEDVRVCIDWDTGREHRDMKSANGEWHKVGDN